MPPPLLETLPDLAAYRRDLVAEGAPAETPLTPAPAEGLLARLPAPPPDAPRGWPWDVQTPPPDPAESAAWPAIHIVVPSYQQGRYIEAALRSILLQNYPRLGLVVLDAGSRDATGAILARYRPWLGHLRVAPDRGQSHALNLGLSLGPGEGLEGWLNSDDLYLPAALHAVARAHVRHRADFIHGDGLALDETTGRLAHDRAGFAHPAFRRYPGAIFSHAAFWSARIRLPLREELHYSLDYELWVRLLPLARRRLHLPRPLGLIRIHPEAKSHSPAAASRWEEDARLNGLAHPGLYAPDPLRRRLHRLANRLVRASRARRSRAAALALCAEAGWPRPVLD